MLVVLRSVTSQLALHDVTVLAGLLSNPFPLPTKAETVTVFAYAEDIRTGRYPSSWVLR
ncbi:uncharacterized protein CLUP02_06731 [Colletotrichum lupini]|uniref:Uncharacterized protein n=1 Tax=Colletotrichum lupini TaxID=145971 RepID=A0A9Q8WG06_9PEZI|nr:uncharacterized protein CLUP02_06731 [Colletotrichum lupini]UQC81245.1 hypothetical protein CLUP02_06731 [Colletotrichum lupini]